MLIFLLPSEIKILCTLPDSIPMVNQHAICNLYVDNMKGITYEQAFSLIWLKSCGFSWPCVLFRTLQLGCWLWLLTLASCWYRPEKAMVVAHLVRLVPPALSLGFSSSSQLLLCPTLPNVVIWGVEPVEASTSVSVSLISKYFKGCKVNLALKKKATLYTLLIREFSLIVPLGYKSLLNINKTFYVGNPNTLLCYI